MWHAIGRSDDSAFFNAMMDLVTSARAALLLSAAFFPAGVAAAGHAPWLHGYLMTAGLIAFYHAVMYVQLPGFINAAPHRAATWLLTALLLLGLLAQPRLGYAAYAPYALLHALLYLRGLWGKPTYYPNVITVAGLLLLPLSRNHLEAAMSFPLASVYSLLYRVEFSRARRRFSASTALSIAALYVAAYLAAWAGHAWAFALPSLALTLYAKPRVEDPYGAGAFFFRWAVALTPAGAHLLYMAFAVIMSALCVPYFVPSILYRQAPSYGWELVAAASAAYLLRNAGVLAASAALVAALVLYAAVRSLRERYYPPTKTPERAERG
ncbi:hypothetical protein [Pyrobaculum neutrophilum]|uniref:Uncharacterized protein n=1 Tax=Pyrobaculum neutrophilum (strain DSM 2338 / JCM 9278 / NBRC 100436 / V24Sta) TaxID=444157 RepID=B1YB27_PYRNV|nr:hypothetical protein [Pyrobaculum neutrophilum]ACB40727.1 conserved hypothetical protein [Pyrobaculum neutrophilum V24Sta]